MFAISYLLSCIVSVWMNANILACFSSGLSISFVLLLSGTKYKRYLRTHLTEVQSNSHGVRIECKESWIPERYGFFVCFWLTGESAPHCPSLINNNDFRSHGNWYEITSHTRTHPRSTRKYHRVARQTRAAPARARGLIKKIDKQPKWQRR